MAHSDFDNKVVQLKIEPDLSDERVMKVLRDAIGYSKAVKCKTVFVLLIPEEEHKEGAMIRVATREPFYEKVRVLDYLNTSLMLMNDYVAKLFNQQPK